MASSGALDHYPMMRDLKWSPAEKAIARKAFERALQQELEEVIRKTKEMAAKIAEPSELWELEHHLTERRKDIDRKYDYKYSVLPMVFGVLIREGWLTEEDLQGLGEDKLGRIRGCATLCLHRAPAPAGWRRAAGQEINRSRQSPLVRDNAPPASPAPSPCGR